MLATFICRCHLEGECLDVSIPQAAYKQTLQDLILVLQKGGASELYRISLELGREATRKAYTAVTKLLAELDEQLRLQEALLAKIAMQMSADEIEDCYVTLDSHLFDRLQEAVLSLVIKCFPHSPGRTFGCTRCATR